MNMKKMMRIPKAIYDEIDRQGRGDAGSCPEALGPDERDDFLKTIPRQFQTEADEVWTRTVVENERKREEWFQRAVTILAPLLDGSYKIPGMNLDVRGSSRPAADKELLTTKEAAEYLHRSASWLAKQNDVPYIRGIPNLYQIRDLDAWIERHKKRPKAA